MRKKLFSILALLLIMAAATGPARAQTVYNDWVYYSDLQVGDVLYKGSYIIGIDSYFRLNIIGGRYKQNATQQLENSQFYNNQITAYNIDGSIEANGNVYTPCSATGADGDAWVVTQIGHDICIAGIKVYTSAVALSSLEEGDILMQGFSITGSGNVQLNEGRYMTGNDVGNVNTTSAVSNLSFGSDCSITTSAGTHYPYNGSAQGNAWYVKSVENGSVQLAGIAIPAANQQGGMTVLWNYAFNLNNNGTITQNDVTLTPGNGDARLLRNFYDYGDNTFSTTLGNFTKIEIICTYGSMSGWTSEVIGQYSEGMMGMGNNMRDLYKLTWTGESNSVTIHASVYGIQAIIFTIAGTERTLTGIPDGWSVTADGQSVTANADGSYTIEAGAAVKLIPPTEVKPTVQTVTVTEASPAAPSLAGVTLTDGMVVEPHFTLNSQDNYVQFIYNAANDQFVMGTEVDGILLMAVASVIGNSSFPNAEIAFTRNGNTAIFNANDDMGYEAAHIEFDFANMTYTQSYIDGWSSASGSFTSITIGGTTITASQMTAQ